MVSNPVRNRIERKGHFIRDRKWELIFGFALSLVGLLLLWDAFDGREKKMPWPLSGMAPW